MQRIHVRYIILIAILSLFSATIFYIQNRQPINKNTIDIFKMPLKIGEWQGEEILAGEETKAILETESVLTRRYTKNDASIWLAIVYYKDSRIALHQPESCGLGQGSRIIERAKEKIKVNGMDDFYANKLIFKSDKISQVMLYYFKTGEINTDSYAMLRWKMIMNKLKSNTNGGALVRFSAPIKNNTDETTEILKQFIREISPLLPKYLI